MKLQSSFTSAKRLASVWEYLKRRRTTVKNERSCADFLLWIKRLDLDDSHLLIAVLEGYRQFEPVLEEHQRRKLETIMDEMVKRIAKSN